MLQSSLLSHYSHLHSMVFSAEGRKGNTPWQHTFSRLCPGSPRAGASGGPQPAVWGFLLLPGVPRTCRAAGHRPLSSRPTGLRASRRNSARPWQGGFRASRPRDRWQGGPPEPYLGPGGGGRAPGDQPARPPAWRSRRQQMAGGPERRAGAGPAAVSARAAGARGSAGRRLPPPLPAAYLLVKVAAAAPAPGGWVRRCQRAASLIPPRGHRAPAARAPPLPAPLGSRAPGPRARAGPRRPARARDCREEEATVTWEPASRGAGRGRGGAGGSAPPGLAAPPAHGHDRPAGCARLQAPSRAWKRDAQGA